MSQNIHSEDAMKLGKESMEKKRGKREGRDVTTKSFFVVWALAGAKFADTSTSRDYHFSAMPQFREPFLIGFVG